MAPRLLQKFGIHHRVSSLARDSTIFIKNGLKFIIFELFLAMYNYHIPLFVQTEEDRTHSF